MERKYASLYDSEKGRGCNNVPFSRDGSELYSFFSYNVNTGLHCLQGVCYDSFSIDQGLSPLTNTVY